MPALWELQRTVQALPEHASLTEYGAYLLDLTLEELVSNIIKYGYDDDGTHEIRIRMEFGGGGAVVSLEDDGRPFDPTRDGVGSAAEELPLERRTVGGLGIHLIRSMAESVEYRRERNRNLLCVRIPAEEKAN